MENLFLTSGAKKKMDCQNHEYTDNNKIRLWVFNPKKNHI